MAFGLKIGGGSKTTSTSTENTYNDASDASSNTLGGGVSADDQINLRGVENTSLTIIKTDSGAVKNALDFGSNALDFGSNALDSATSALDNSFRFGRSAVTDSLNFGKHALDAVVDAGARESDANVKLYDNAISHIVSANRSAQSNVLSAANNALQFATPTEQKVTKYVVIAVAVIGVALAITFAVRR